jgi:hypothetical protein
MAEMALNSTAMTPPRASFLGLPLEVRRMIYRYLLSAPKNLNLFEIDGLVKDCWVRPSYEQRLDMTLNILRSCRQCRSEAAPMFWELNTLDFRSATNHESFDSVSHFFTKNILGGGIAHRILHCVDQTNVRFLDNYLAQVPNLAQLFTKCKTLDLEVANDASRPAKTSLAKFDADILGFALAFTLSHPTLVKAIRTRAESVRMAKRSVASIQARVDEEDCHVKHLHFVTEDYVLKNGVRFRSNWVVTAPCNADGMHAGNRRRS